MFNSRQKMIVWKNIQVASARRQRILGLWRFKRLCESTNIFFSPPFFSGNRANKSQSESLSIHNSLLVGVLDLKKSENPDRSGVLLLSRWVSEETFDLFPSPLLSLFFFLLTPSVSLWPKPLRPLPPLLILCRVHSFARLLPLLIQAVCFKHIWRSSRWSELLAAVQSKSERLQKIF